MSSQCIIILQLGLSKEYFKKYAGTIIGHPLTRQMMADFYPIEVLAPVNDFHIAKCYTKSFNTTSVQPLLKEHVALDRPSQSLKSVCIRLL